MRQSYLLLIVVLQCVIAWQTGYSANTSSTPTSTPTTQMPCKYRNDTCKECVKGHNCYWCEPTKTCFYFDSTIADPKPTTCKDNKWKVGQCLIPGNILIIIVPSAVGFVLLVIIVCVLYCCCCRKKKGAGKSKYDKEDAKYKRQKEEIEFKAAARREERKKKNDEIRKKYGLFKDDDEGEMGYRRFDNVA